MRERQKQTAAGVAVTRRSRSTADGGEGRPGRRALPGAQLLGHTGADELKFHELFWRSKKVLRGHRGLVRLAWSGLEPWSSWRSMIDPGQTVPLDGEDSMLDSRWDHFDVQDEDEYNNATAFLPFAALA